MKFIVLLISTVALILCGCDEKEGENSPASAVASTEESSSEVFVGVIRADLKMGSALDRFKITYTIGKNSIRRESIPVGAIDKLLKNNNRAGVICSPEKNEVVLYYVANHKKHFCKLTTAEYKTMLKDQTFGYRNRTHGGYGSIFLQVPEKPDTEENYKEHSSISGQMCDLHMMSFIDGSELITIKTDHCQSIRVPREFIELVEPSISHHVTGFPLRISRNHKHIPSTASGGLEGLLKKAGNIIAERADKLISNYEIKVTHIIETPLESTDFTLPDDFVMLKDLNAFENAFSVDIDIDLD